MCLAWAVRSCAAQGLRTECAFPMLHYWCEWALKPDFYLRTGFFTQTEKKKNFWGRCVHNLQVAILHWILENITVQQLEMKGNF